MKTTAVESSALKSIKRSTSKSITCPACGQTNFLKKKLYYWLLTKEKKARCMHCGRSIPIQT